MARQLVCQIGVLVLRFSIYLPMLALVPGRLSSSPWPRPLAVPLPPPTWAAPGSSASAPLPVGSPEAAAGPRSRMSSSAMVNWARVFTICSIRPARRRGGGSGAAGRPGPLPPFHPLLPPPGLARPRRRSQRRLQCQPDGSDLAGGAAVTFSARLVRAPRRQRKGGRGRGGRPRPSARPRPPHPPHPHRPRAARPRPLCSRTRRRRLADPDPSLVRTEAGPHPRTRASALGDTHFSATPVPYRGTHRGMHTPTQSRPTHTDSRPRVGRGPVHARHHDPAQTRTLTRTKPTQTAHSGMSFRGHTESATIVCNYTFEQLLD